MISHESKCIFVHIPKCAGSSVEVVLGHTVPDSTVKEPDHRSIRMMEQPIPVSRLLTLGDNLTQFALRCRHRLLRHDNPENLVTLSPAQYRDYFKFTVVRNPWGRAYSWYKNCMRDPDHQRRFGLTSRTTLAEFLARWCGRGALRPQTAWLKDYSGAIPMDFIARFESLGNDFAEVSRRLNLPTARLPHELKGSGEDYRAQFDRSSIELVGRVYAEEIGVFGYSFDA
jgi:Sulfotransferase family